MGAPIKHRKKFIAHKKKWDKNTIEEEVTLVRDYALKNKKEIRKVELSLSKYKLLAKRFNRSNETKNSVEAKHFIEKLKNLGYLNIDATSLDEVLDITLRDIFERRLSNLLYKKKLSKSPSQARQFIVHRHVKVGGKVVSSPSYSVSLLEETTIEFSEGSPLTNEEHPERKLVVEGIENELSKQESIIPEKKVEIDTEAKVENEEADEVNE